MPWFTTLFGRDSIITALEVLPFMPDVARETLKVLAEWQATEDDPERDMEPGKILHELRVGELARTGELPHRPYYGSIDSTPLWLILLDETYRWTGDIDMVRSLWPNAIAALEWIDRYGDRDGDGFVEYERRPRTASNQGWKDRRWIGHRTACRRATDRAVRDRATSRRQAPMARSGAPRRTPAIEASPGGSAELHKRFTGLLDADLAYAMARQDNARCRIAERRP